MSNFGTMIARINDELGLPSVSARIPNAILAAIRFYEAERFWFIEAEATASTVIGQQNYVMPTDYLEPDSLTVTESNVRHMLKRRPCEWLRQHSLDTTSGARPKDWAYYGDQIWLFPIPDQVYTLQLSYLKRLTVLSAFADTDNWMVDGEELIRARAKYDLLMHSAKDYAAAAAMAPVVEAALSNLRGKSESKIATGKMSFDDSLANINWE